MNQETLQFNQDNADLLVFTYKEGLLSAIAHDLKIRVTQFSIRIDRQKNAIEASFDPRSLQVVCAMRDGSEAPGALSDSDARKIEDNIASEVLHSKKFPEIVFTSKSVEEDESGYRIFGQLTMHGAARDISFTSRSDGEGQVAKVTLHQPDWKIVPYSAMLGTLKIKPDIVVTIALPGLL